MTQNKQTGGEITCAELTGVGTRFGAQSVVLMLLIYVFFLIAIFSSVDFMVAVTLVTVGLSAFAGFSFLQYRLAAAIS